MAEGGITQNTGKGGDSVMGEGQETSREWCKCMQFREGNAESTNQRLTIHHPQKFRISGAGPVRSGLSWIDIPKLLHGPNTDRERRPDHREQLRDKQYRRPRVPASVWLGLPALPRSPPLKDKKLTSFLVDQTRYVKFDVKNDFFMNRQDTKEKSKKAITHAKRTLLQKIVKI